MKLRDAEEAVAAGAEEIDMVISREAFLSGDDTRVMEEIVRVREACGDAHLKVILETSELGSYDHVRHASMLAMEAGADFIKTSTGKSSAGATPGVTLVMLEAIRDYAERSGRTVGMKAAGGISNSKAALHRLVLVKETLGDEWLTPERFRLGASSLLNDLLMQYEKTETAATRGPRTSRRSNGNAGDTHPDRLGLRARPESPDHVRLRDSYGLFIDGDFRDPLDGTRVPSINPATESHSPRWPSPGRRTCAARSSRPAPRNRAGRG